MDDQPIAYILECLPLAYRDSLPLGVYEARGGVEVQCYACHAPLMALRSFLNDARKQAGRHKGKHITVCQFCGPLVRQACLDNGLDLKDLDSTEAPPPEDN